MNNTKSKITITEQEKNILEELSNIFSDLPERILSDKKYLQKEDIFTDADKKNYSNLFFEMKGEITQLLKKFSNGLTAEFTYLEITQQMENLLLSMFYIQYNKKYVSVEKKITRCLIGLFDKFFIINVFNKKLSMMFLKLTKGNIIQMRKLVNFIPFAIALLFTAICVIFEFVLGSWKWDIINCIMYIGVLLSFHGIFLMLLKVTTLFFTQFHRSRQEHYYTIGGLILLLISQLLRILSLK